MWWNRCTPAPGRTLALTLTALSGLAGCQHLDMPNPTSALSWSDGATPGAGPSRNPELAPVETISTAQEADMQIAMGRLAERRGEMEQAMAAYQAALTRDQNRADAHHRLAILKDLQGNFRESAELYRRALELEPGSPDIYSDMGYSLSLQRRWAEAERSLRQAIVLQPDHQRSHNNLALVLAHTNRPDEALAEFRRGGNGDAEAHSNLAFVLTLDRQWTAARMHYERALAADPSSQLTQQRLQELGALASRLAPARVEPSRDTRVMPASATAPRR